MRHKCLFSRNNHQSRIVSGGPRSANYVAIDWTKPLIDELFGLYTYDPLSMQCNRSNGERFEGADWEAAATVPYDLQLKPSRLDEWCPSRDHDEMDDPLEEGRCGYLGECEY